MSLDRLREHNVYLIRNTLTLRPMTESDWDILLVWNNDPEVLYYSEGDDIKAWSLEDMKAMYRGVSQKAFCFIAEVGGRPIGECWLQQMNLERILKKYPSWDLRRIDLMIGEKAFWNHGYGTEMIRLLTDFGFLRENADAIFGLGIADYNPRSKRAFEKVGYQVDEEIQEPPGRKAKPSYDMILTKDKVLFM